VCSSSFCKVKLFFFCGPGFSFPFARVVTRKLLLMLSN
jgi:hypothetical protein